jgi:hypothetical protein
MSVDRGIVSQILALPCKVTPSFSATVQIVSIKKLDSQNSVRYRAELTDGSNLLSAMFSSQSVPDIEAGLIMVSSIIRMNQFMVNEVGGQK